MNIEEGGTFRDVYKASWKGKGGDHKLFAIKVLRKQGKFVKAGAETERDICILRNPGGHQCILTLVGWRETHFNTQLMTHYHPQDLTPKKTNNCQEASVRGSG
jgi:hypothetical protein